MGAEAKENPYPHLVDHQTGLYDWDPGNGCRYHIAVTQTGRGRLVTWLRHEGIAGTSFWVIDDARDAIGIVYFMEKMQISERHMGDGRAILNFMVHMGITKSYY